MTCNYLLQAIGGHHKGLWLQTARVSLRVRTWVWWSAQKVGHVHAHICVTPVCILACRWASQTCMPHRTVPCARRTGERQCLGMCEYACIYGHVCGWMAWCAAGHRRTLALACVCTHALVYVGRGTFMYLCPGFSQRNISSPHGPSSSRQT